MGNLILSGSTSGQVTVQPPAVAGTSTLTLPSGSGTVAVNGISTNVASLGAVTASGTSVDFTSIPAYARKVTLVYNQLSTNGTSDYLIQLGTASSIETSGYLANAVTVASISTGYSFTTGYGFIISPSAANSYSGVVTFFLVSDASYAWSANGMGSAGSTTIQFASGGKVLGGVLTRLRVTTSGGANTFDNGTINVFYE
jgi:hypothetical protein